MGIYTAVDEVRSHTSVILTCKSYVTGGVTTQQAWAHDGCIGRRLDYVTPSL